MPVCSGCQHSLCTLQTVSCLTFLHVTCQVDMPVFFYIDPDFTEDPAMAKVDTITLSYTFFEAKEAEKMGI